MEAKNVTKKRREKTFGQQERYLAVTKSIFHERLKGMGNTWLRNIDITMAVPKLVRKVRRIIEKRMCQTYHKQHKCVFHDCGNRSRHHMKRAVSYELFIMGQVENVHQQSRGDSTHWKRSYDPYTGRVVFKKKHGYDTVEEAKAMAVQLVKDNPWCEKAVGVYKCAYCHKYHIGHESSLTTASILQIQPIATA
ncbi:MAG: hypothetical protein J6T38_04145 [Bacteroidaceae bacterium]|nr:hypothetical protein [Bacteroidaceae bacterium]